MSIDTTQTALADASTPTRSSSMTRHDLPTDELTAEYLERLRRASADLPEAPRADLLDSIQNHLAESLGRDAELGQVRAVLDELGTPEQIAAAARAESGTRPQRSTAELVYDVSAVLLLLLGGFLVPLLGWVAGVVMLWNGPRWTTNEKWLGTLTWPAVAAAGVIILLLGRGEASVATTTLAAVGGLAVLVGLIVAFTYLLRAAARARD